MSKMVNALHAFGLAIGWMEIVGVLCFELIMFYMMRRRRLAEKDDLATVEAPADPKVKKSRNSWSKLLSRKNLRESQNAWIFWGYLFMLNLWIAVTLLMIAGITMQKPELMTIYLTWCACGLVLDVLIIIWWVFEFFAGDAIVAMTNILISLLTLAVEVGFILVIYAIYLNLSHSAEVEESKMALYFHWLLLE